MKKEKVDPRTIPVDTDVLVRWANEPVGGSGIGVFVNGTMASMAREILKSRGIEWENQEEKL